MMKNRKLVKGIALAAVITALAAGGTAAYLTDFETATNSFTVGKVDIDLDEPNWKPEDNTDLVPTQVIRKDPYVANKGVNEAFVYLEVSVPVRNVITVAKDGTRNALAKTELFSFTKNKDWTQLERTEVGQNMVYTYAYNHILKPGTKTTTLFDTVPLPISSKVSWIHSRLICRYGLMRSRLPIPGMTRLRFWSRQLLLTRNM